MILTLAKIWKRFMRCGPRINYLMKLAYIRAKNLGERGQIALTAVLVLLAVALVVAIGASLAGIGELDLGLSQSLSEKSQAVAAACAEEGLLRLRRDFGYTGGNLELDAGTCIITVTVTAPTTRQVLATATISQEIRKVRVNVTSLSGALRVDSWQQVP